MTMTDKTCQICGGYGYIYSCTIDSPTAITPCKCIELDNLGLKKLFDAAKGNKEVAIKLKEAAVAAHYFDLANELREIERSIPENLNDKEQMDKQDNDKIYQTKKKRRTAKPIKYAPLWVRAFLVFVPTQHRITSQGYLVFSYKELFGNRWITETRPSSYHGVELYNLND